MREETVILSNSGYCTSCNSYIYSGHRHDYVSCECGSVSVDGGGEYLRRVGGVLEGGFKDTSIEVSKENYAKAFEYIHEDYEDNTLRDHPDATTLGILKILKLHGKTTVEQQEKAVNNFNWAINNNRNEYGIICAVARGYKELPNKRWFE